MNYPTPMDVAEAEDSAADALDEALEWPYSREVWDQIDAERVELLAANEALAARLAEAERVLRICANYPPVGTRPQDAKPFFAGFIPAEQRAAREYFEANVRP